MARAVALGVAVLLAALPTQAQELAPVPFESPRTGGLTFRLGLYQPQIDSESDLTGEPYKAIFDDESMLLGEVELERFFYQGIGTAGLGLSVGYAEKYAQALLADGTQSAESTALQVVPLRLRGVYRFDYPAFEWHIPVVPYVKLGLVYELWWMSKGGQVEVVGGNRAAGSKWGWEAVGGLSLLLDVLEPRLARDFDTGLGVNHSYLFAEYTYAKVNNFGGKGLDLSDGYWMFGLSLDY